MSRARAVRSAMNGTRARSPFPPALIVALLGAATAEAGTPASLPIRDNSFLVEEAYNQESRVVQHIGVWSRFEPGGEHLFSFTQEWPLAKQRHQLSYTLPLESRIEGGSRDKAVGVFEVIVIAHIDHHLAILVEDDGCSLMGHAAKGGALYRG